MDKVTGRQRENIPVTLSPALVVLIQNGSATSNFSKRVLFQHARQFFFVESDHRVAVHDDERTTDQARFLDHQREQFVVRDRALVQSHLFVRRTFCRDDIARRQFQRFQQRAQLVRCERLFEKIARRGFEFFLGKKLLRVAAGRSRRAPVQLNLFGHTFLI